MTERRVLIVIDPPEQGRCDGCRRFKLGAIDYFCELEFDWPIEQDLLHARPAACIAAEAEAAQLDYKAEMRAWDVTLKDGLEPESFRDRVADALAAVLGPEPAEL